MVAARRLIVLMLALLVVSSIAAALAPVREADEDTSTTSTTATEPPPGELLRETIDAGERKPARIALELGDQLELQVTAKRVDEVEIAGLGLLEQVDPNAAARFSLLPREAGRYEVRLLDADRTIGWIEIAARRDTGERNRPDEPGRPDPPAHPDDSPGQSPSDSPGSSTTASTVGARSAS